MNWKLNYEAAFHGRNAWIRGQVDIPNDMFNRIIDHQCSFLSGISDYHQEHIHKHIDDVYIGDFTWGLLVKEWQQIRSDWEDITGNAT